MKIRTYTGTGCIPRHFGSQMRVDIVAVVMASRPLPYRRDRVVHVVATRYGERRRARIELEIDRLIGSGFLLQHRSFLDLGFGFPTIHDYKSVSGDPNND